MGKEKSYHFLTFVLISFGNVTVFYYQICVDIRSCIAFLSLTRMKTVTLHFFSISPLLI
ncbi:hypothetical protein Lalb_Chr17g0345701 [Lupinus albus]|uniref:Uncharacterized protein n=1 Tax=Lupinus albus TaxID=3870 RepID=A0A6A4P8F8_LUPAL|nr:hypothetical protein Lalb_Chr17g0345701 [Lupinus albus]